MSVGVSFVVASWDSPIELVLELQYARQREAVTRATTNALRRCRVDRGATKSSVTSSMSPKTSTSFAQAPALKLVRDVDVPLVGLAHSRQDRAARAAAASSQRDPQPLEIRAAQRDRPAPRDRRPSRTRSGRASRPSRPRAAARASRTACRSRAASASPAPRSPLFPNAVVTMPPRRYRGCRRTRLVSATSCRKPAAAASGDGCTSSRNSALG